MALPVDGQLNWGDPLNAYILAVQSVANTAQTNLNSHAANSPADPHGDRAYAQSLVTPITSGTNQANGYVKLNSSGRIPASLITGSGGPGGMYTAVFDAVATYGMTAGSSDCSTQLQAALDAAQTAGGGIVWVGPGNFSLANYVVIHSNTWLLLSEGTTLTRISSGVAPSHLISNVKFSTSNTPASNVRISGGKIDAIGSGLTSACTPIFVIQSTYTNIYSVNINVPNGNPAIELNGCSRAYVTECYITAPGSAAQFNPPAIRLNVSDTGTTPSGFPAGIYNEQACSYVFIDGCVVPKNSHTYNGFGAFCGFDDLGLTPAGSPGNHQVITITNNTFLNAATLNDPITYTLMGQYTASGNKFSDYGYTNLNSSSSWQALNLQNSWVNSGIGPHAQWRFVPGDQTTIEIIGDVTIGLSGDGVSFASFPQLSSLASINTTQVATPFLLPGGGGTTASRVFVGTAGGINLQCYGVSTQSGNRATFHGFISLTA